MCFCLQSSIQFGERLSLLCFFFCLFGVAYWGRWKYKSIKTQTNTASRSQILHFISATFPSIYLASLFSDCAIVLIIVHLPPCWFGYIVSSVCQSFALLEWGNFVIIIFFLWNCAMNVLYAVWLNECTISVGALTDPAS